MRKNFSVIATHVIIFSLCFFLRKDEKYILNIEKKNHDGFSMFIEFTLKKNATLELEADARTLLILALDSIRF